MQNISQIPTISQYIWLKPYFERPKSIVTHLCASPLVSIVTIVKNETENLMRTIKSVSNQDYDNIEHIIVNGGERIELDFNNNTYLLNQADLGISDAFNKGVAASNGSIVCILNSGDEFLPDAISFIVKSFDINPNAEIICASAIFQGFEDAIFYRFSDDKKLLSFMSVVHPATFVLKDVYERIGLFRLEYKFAMDYDFLLRAKKSSINFLTLNKSVACFYSNGRSDRCWFDAFLESLKVKKANIGTALIYDAYRFLYQFFYYAIRNARLYWIIKIYRTYFPSLSAYRKQ